VQIFRQIKTTVRHNGQWGKSLIKNIGTIYKQKKRVSYPLYID
jgi:hypothetical protein